MAKFSYTAIEAATGRERSGEVESANVEQAAASLKAKGLAPMRVEAAPQRKTAGAIGDAEVRAKRGQLGRKRSASRRAGGWGALWPSVKAKELTQCTRQLATLLKAGMPLLRSIEVLARQEKSTALRSVLEDLAETIRSGGNFSEGLERHPKVFDRLYVNMAKAGEAGGVLETVLERVAQFREKAERVKGRVKSAMTYPLIVMLLAVAIVSALMVFVVPRFEQIFAGLLKGQPLPGLTRAVLEVSRFLQEHAVVCVAVAASGGVAFQAFRRTEVGRRVLDGCAIRIPAWGDLVLKAAVARFSRTFGTLLASGVPMLQALSITRDTSGNMRVAEAIDAVHDRVREGDDVARPLADTAVFPPMVASMVEVGEETGALPEMLGRIADTYDEEVDRAVASLTSLIEPLMIVFLAGVVGTIVIALFLPIVSIIQHLQ